MKVKMGESKYGAPLGPPYAAEFVQVEEVEAKANTNLGPGWRWQFRIVEGEHAGNIVSRTTGREPSAKNACGKMPRRSSGGRWRSTRRWTWPPMSAGATW